MHRQHRIALASLIVICLCFPMAASAGPSFDQKKLDAIPGEMKRFVDKEVSGAVTIVATADGIVHESAVGEADIAKHTPMEKDAIFWIASMTKPITGAAILILQDEGKLSIEDPVGKYIPSLGALKTADGKPAKTITLKHLLTHTAGMSENTGEETNAAKNLTELVAGFAARPVQFEAGARWQYSQSGINALGRIVEVVSGDSYDKFVEKRIFQPLGMKDTTFYPSKEQQARIATSYALKEGVLQPTDIFIFAGRNLAERDRTLLPNGGLFSTARDYARFARMLLRGGELDGKQILKAESVKLMGTPLTHDIPKVGFVPGSEWGCAVSVVTDPQGVTGMLSKGTFGHGGAYGTQAWIDPTNGTAYILMVQRANFPNGDDSPVRMAFQKAAAAAREH